MMMINGNDIFLAWLLLMGSCVESDYKNWNNAGVRSALTRICTDNEILSSHEKPYWFGAKHDLKSDCAFMRSRLEQYREYPKCHEFNNLPSFAILDKGREFNREFTENMEKEITLNFDRSAVFLETISEAKQLYKIWDAAYDARYVGTSVTYQRDALRRLKELLQDWDGDTYNMTYYGHKPFPPCAPFWRFREHQK
jgi:hypothetical protein